MEILEIRSSHDLTVRPERTRPQGAHSYQVNTRQFSSIYRQWRRQRDESDGNLEVMTLSFDRIWITGPEAQQVSEAIESAQTPIAIE